MKAWLSFAFILGFATAWAFPLPMLHHLEKSLMHAVHRNFALTRSAFRCPLYVPKEVL